MEIFTTILTIISGIDYMILLLRFFGRWITIIQIQNKIKYYENAKLFIDVTQTIHTHTKNKSFKRKNNCILYMSSVFKRLNSVCSDITLSYLERQDRRHHQRQNKLNHLRKEKLKKEDEKKEKELFKMGFLRDELSKHYYEPSQLLHDIYTALIKKYPCRKDDFDKLILNEHQEQFDEEDFAVIKDCLLYVKILDRMTQLDFRCKLLNEPVYSPSNIIWLQYCDKMMYKVTDISVIKHENKFVEEERGVCV